MLQLIFSLYFSYVKVFPHCIKFSSNLRGVAYGIDEAWVRTCWESFNDLLESDVTQDMIFSCDASLNIGNKIVLVGPLNLILYFKMSHYSR